MNYYYYLFQTHKKRSIAQYTTFQKTDKYKIKHTIRNDYNSQRFTIHKKNVQILVYRLKRQRFHYLEVNLAALIARFASVVMMLLNDSVNLHIHLYMRFLSTAGQVDTSTLTRPYYAPVELFHQGSSKQIYVLPFTSL